MLLRDYQATAVSSVRVLMREHRAIMLQLATGAGKTPIAAEIIRSSFSRGFRIWFVAPRGELLEQASAHLKKHDIPHGFIKAGMAESRAY